MRSTLLRGLAIAGLATTLGGCAVLGLLGGGKKNATQMYRFGADASAVVAAAPTAGPVVQLNGVVLQRSAEGDRMLAVTGPEVYYIAAARWVSPAEELFTQAADRAFDRAGLNLVRRGQPQAAVANLNLTVPVFETRYLNGAAAAPTIVVEVEAALSSTTGDRAPLGVTRAVASVPAETNTVTAIVAAYDAASRQTLDEVAAWARSTTGAAPRT